MLVVRASLDDPERFGEIFDRHHRAIWMYLARAGGRQAADDLAGEVFVAAFETRSRFDEGRGSVRSWLFGIASNLLRSRFRNEERARRAFGRLSGERVGIDDMASVDDLDELRTRSVSTRRAVSKLCAADREIIVMAVWEDLTYVEIASVLGVRVGTVRSRLSRAREKLRELVSVDGEVLDRTFTEELTDGL